MLQGAGRLPSASRARSAIPRPRSDLLSTITSPAPGAPPGVGEVEVERAALAVADERDACVTAAKRGRHRRDMAEAVHRGTRATGGVEAADGPRAATGRRSLTGAVSGAAQLTSNAQISESAYSRVRHLYRRRRPCGVTKRVAGRPCRSRSCRYAKARRPAISVPVRGREGLQRPRHLRPPRRCLRSVRTASSASASSVARSIGGSWATSATAADGTSVHDATSSAGSGSGTPRGCRWRTVTRVISQTKSTSSTVTSTTSTPSPVLDSVRSSAGDERTVSSTTRCRAVRR